MMRAYYWATKPQICGCKVAGTGRCVRAAHSPHTPPPSGAVRGAACVRGTCGVYACNWRMCGLYGDVNACVRACACAKWGGSYPRGFRCSSFIAWHHHHVTANARCSGTSLESQFGPAPTVHPPRQPLSPSQKLPTLHSLMFNVDAVGRR